MKLSKIELKELSEVIAQSILTESKLFGEVSTYKATELYKTKSSLYCKVLSEYYGREITINEDSMFGMLDYE